MICTHELTRRNFRFHAIATRKNFTVFGIDFSWGFASSFGIAAHFEVEDGQGVCFELGIPFALSLFLTFGLPERLLRWILPRTELTGVGYYPVDRMLSVSSHGGCVWWQLWTHPHGGDTGLPGGRDIASWREGSFPLHPAGQRRYTYRDLGDARPGEVPLPEQSYPVSIQDTVELRARPAHWWPFQRVRVLRRVRSLTGGLPHPGKGESSYDCGDDALTQVTVDVDSDIETVELVAEIVMDRRRRYASEDWVPTKKERT